MSVGALGISWRRVFALVAVGCWSIPGAAQVRTVDPNAAAAGSGMTSRAPSQSYAPDEEPVDAGSQDTAPAQAPVASPVGTARSGAGTGAEAQASAASETATYQEGDLIDAAEGVFGKGAEGLAKLIEKILKDQGRPVAYIAGREAGGAFVAGIRYGSGEMFHKVEGKRPVFWTGPSIGFDVGASGAKTFVLVYNLYDSQELFRRYPAIEGQAYFVGGFNASYLRRGQVVLIPIRLGVGWRLGANIGYMRFSEKGALAALLNRTVMRRLAAYRPPS